MTEEKIICQVCGKEFLYTQNERAFLEDLLKQGKIPEVITPKKCLPCRSQVRRKRGTVLGAHGRAVSQARRASEVPEVSAPSSSVPVVPEGFTAAHSIGCMCPRCGDQSKFKQTPMQVVITPLPLSHVAVPAPVPVPVPAPAPGTPTAEEIVVLVASDFEALVCREDVVWRQGNRKIRIRLADIGPEALKKAMEAAVLRWWKS